jgi:hypothetical protein
MKERLMTFACALGALALFLAMFMPGNDRGDDEVPRPTSQEQRPNGYHGAMSWLDAAHIKTVSVRDRFDKLATLRGLPASGSLLIVTLPDVTAFKTDEFPPLDSWIRAGNTLLVLAALSDNPDWAFVPGRAAASGLSLLTGLEFEAVKTRSSRASRRATLVPNGSYGGYFAGVRTAVGLSDYPAQSWTVKTPYDGIVLSLARERETGEALLWTRPLGNGRIIVSGLGSLFTNRALGLADNGRLLANIVAASLGPGGAVLFDDMHQGLAAAYDPDKFYSDRRLYLTVGILAALWLCWVLGSTQLQLSVIRAPAPREVELVQTTGTFLARVLTPDAGARGLFEHFFRRLRERLPQGRQGSNPPWELLEGHPGVTSAELQQLRDWYAAVAASRAVPLQRLHNLIVKVERYLAA